MKIDFKMIYDTTYEHYEKAKHNLECNYILEHEERSEAISDVIPGFNAEKLEFGSFDKENYAVLFVDMRQSTQRANKMGPEKTFLTMHVFLTALLELIRLYHGKVIDIMGDGLMVFWGGKKGREFENMYKGSAIQSAGLCGRDMLIVKDRVINPIIEQESLGPLINIGIGVTFGSVIVTKIGIEGSYDVKAFGDCINDASNFASQTYNKVKVSKKVKYHWPSSKNGKIRFTPAGNDGTFFLEYGEN